ncbi:MAG: hypothetical protein QOE73_773 [Verrucomicrobiota bacterium]
MRRRGLTALLVFLAGMSFSICAAKSIQPANPHDGWTFLKESGGITLYSRARAGSLLKEFRAVGEINAPSRAVHNVIDDLEGYPSFMPYTAECRVLKREGDSVLTYQRVSPKIIGDRDYTLRIHKKSWPMENGLAYLNSWEPANEQGPGEKRGVFRVKLCDGSWLLEPDGRAKTRATYSIYTDSGMVVPALIANHFSEIGIKKLFAAVRKQVGDPRYNAK